MVGPNNAGKSEFIRGVGGIIANGLHPPLFVKGRGGRQGTSDDLLNWLSRISDPDHPGKDPIRYLSAWGDTNSMHARHTWDDRTTYPGLIGFFVKQLTTEQRLQGANPANNIPLTRERPQDPIHHMMRDDRLAARINGWFRQAFDCDLIVHRNAGSEVPLYTGNDPPRLPTEDRVSVSYLRSLEALPRLEQQGDGMRSFASILLATNCGYWSSLAIDEPEAFLHPPQIRVLARALANGATDPVDGTPLERQLALATHSGDLLRGLLDAAPKRVRVVRIRREANTNYLAELSSSDLDRLWSDPLLRHSNLLDAVFHEKAIICEGDPDCRFYSAVAAAIGTDRDVLFGHCGGKHRLHVGVAALRALAVPVAAIADIDVLNDEQVFKRLYEAFGGSWDTVSASWRIVKSQVEAGVPQRSLSEVFGEIRGVLEAATGSYLTMKDRNRIAESLRASSPWASIKKAGKAAIPRGHATAAFESLTRECRSVGLYIVEVGELEQFLPSIGNHGPEWCIEALSQDLASPALNSAREFVRSVVSGAA
ncbi:MAG: ATP-binding protein [Phycisphaerales bacterium]|nr:ATP-binding protein [Phycisphaerales bacterium]